MATNKSSISQNLTNYRSARAGAGVGNYANPVGKTKKAKPSKAALMKEYADSKYSTVKGRKAVAKHTGYVSKRGLTK